MLEDLTVPTLKSACIKKRVGNIRATPTRLAGILQHQTGARKSPDLNLSYNAVCEQSPN